MNIIIINRPPLTRLGIVVFGMLVELSAFIEEGSYAAEGRASRSSFEADKSATTTIDCEKIHGSKLE